MAHGLVLACLLLAVAPAAAQTFVFGLSAEPVQLDPAIVSDSASLAVTYQIFEGLVRLRGATTEIEPALPPRQPRAGPPSAGATRGVRPATARTLRGAACHIAAMDTTLQAIASQNAVA